MLIVNSRRCSTSVCFAIFAGGWGGGEIPGVSKRSVLDIRRKKQHIAPARFPQLVCCFNGPWSIFGLIMTGQHEFSLKIKYFQLVMNFCP